MSITVSEIVKDYGSQRALDQVSFALEKGEIVGFLGPNGAGKSTLMKILTTYLTATAGKASVNGYDVVADKAQVKASIGYLPEHNPLYLDMYVKEYLGFCADAYQTEKSKIDTVIELTGLQPEAHKKIGSLSKGYRQRVGLAAALLHDPEVLILDEPTTGLDPNQLLEIRKLIKEIGKDKTILLSTHIMKEVEAVCDRVIIINKGKLVADKSLKALQQDQEQLIQVEFDYRVEEGLLKRLPHAVEAINQGGFLYEIKFNTQEDMRSAVYDFAQENGLKTLQLNRKNQNLEALFNQLTQ
ncbi:gliding motility-associated ABC transporter ATP-binding subunit GldA [Sediminicola luteus]|uniref:Gliding motility-associated ABC transporter ATP-binding subunit GldA n=1 Tax=Sediminicola luteus TaxID=319238 RepID=A0A2A4G5T2_9FLAO|nr:gliding motility-associated ABC transporter ATP-binding subunit GldA [Sediminicola luteus]PCE63350.1 gliding motility-associated ABC transporter ATP-binding subunit GldA [Sediminicola luteus]